MIAVFRFLFLLFLTFPGYVLCQNPAIVSGVLEGVGDNEIIYIESNGGFFDTTVVRNGEFKFVLDIPAEWDVFFIEHRPKDANPYSFPIFISRGSILNFHLDKRGNPSLSGDKMAREQNDFIDGLIRLNERINQLNEQIKQLNDESKQKELQKEIEDIELKISDYPVAWVYNHKNSPFSVAVINLFILPPLWSEQNDLAKKCFEALSPEALKNNYQTDLLKNRLPLSN